MTFYKSIDQLPAFDDYSMKSRTYRYLAAAPLYGFGDGLSYTQFAYSDAKLSSSTLAAGDPLKVSVKVENTGKVAGDEVVEVYLVPPASDVAPKQELVGFTRVHLAAGVSKDVIVTIDPRQLSLVDAQGKRAILAGEYKLFVGGRQPVAGQQSLALTMTGAKPLPE